MWSVGCIFAELLLKEPLFQAKTEIELISMIFKLLGPPTNDSWPEYSSLPLAKTITPPSPQPHQFRQKFPFLTISGIDLLLSLLTYDPERRISAEEALQHPYFSSVAILLVIHTHTNDLLLAVKLRHPSIQTCSAHSHLQQQANGARNHNLSPNYSSILFQTTKTFQLAPSPCPGHRSQVNRCRIARSSVPIMSIQ